MNSEKYLRLKVHPDAKGTKITEKGENQFEVWVKEPAEAGRANRAVLTALAEHLNLPRGRLWIVKGSREPSKVIAVRPLKG